MPIANALASLVYLATKCKTVVAHNLDFDAMMIASECHRLGQSSLINHVQHECTMKIATPFCKLPGRYGDYKWPSLAETHRHFFGTEVQGAHDAMADVLACARCYFEIKKLLAAKPNNPAEAIETDTMSA